MMKLIGLMIILYVLLSIIKVHFKTASVSGLATVWGLIIFIVYFIIGIILKLSILISFELATIGFISAFSISWILFKVSNYLEKYLIFRVTFLVITVMLLPLVPSLSGKLFFKLIGLS